MLLNLKKELGNKKLNYKTVGRLLGISEKSVYSKISENTEFTLGEALKINDCLFPEFSFKYLFATDETETAESTATATA